MSSQFYSRAASGASFSAGSASASASTQAYGSQPTGSASTQAYGSQPTGSALGQFASRLATQLSASRYSAAPAASGLVRSPTAGYLSQQASYAPSRQSASRGLSAAASATNLSRRSQQSGSSAGAAASQIEQAVINAKQPIQTNEREQITAGQYRGIYLNKSEAAQFRGPVPLDQYQINDDPNPEVIRKRLDKVKYTQEVAVRYLNPPLPPKPGNLIIRERQAQIPAAPPVVIRQEGRGAATPAPLVLRERPPQPPARIPEQVVEVEGQPIPPPARRVVFEKLSNLPAKPQNIIVEKWLPYKQQKRRVVFERSCAQAAPNPRNLVIEWEAPEVEVEKVCKELGTVDADPEEYLRKYGCELKDGSELPDCGEKKCGGGSRASASRAQGNGLPELEGDVQALRLVDLEQHGLGAYRSQLGQ